MSEGVGLGGGAAELGVEGGNLRDEAGGVESGEEAVPGEEGGAKAEGAHVAEGAEGGRKLAAGEMGADEGAEEGGVEAGLGGRRAVAA